jgi:uncharacterized protein YndB with AHSA1/START domain
MRNDPLTKGWLYLSHTVFNYNTMQQHIQFSDHKGRIEKKKDTYHLVFDRVLDHPIEKVWAAISQASIISTWLSPNVTASTTAIDLRPGGQVQLQLLMASVSGTITQLAEGQLLEITFEDQSKIRWELNKIGAHTSQLTFTSVFTDNNPAAGDLREVLVGWHGYIDFLSNILNGIAIPPFPAAQWHEVAAPLYDQYNDL